MRWLLLTAHFQFFSSSYKLIIPDDNTQFFIGSCVAYALTIHTWIILGPYLVYAFFVYDIGDWEWCLHCYILGAPVHSISWLVECKRSRDERAVFEYFIGK